MLVSILFISSPGLTFAKEVIPNQILSKLLDNYTNEEIELIYNDYKIISDKLFKNAISSENPFFIATVGPSGTDKSEAMDKYLSVYYKNQNYVLISQFINIFNYMLYTYVDQSQRNLNQDSISYAEFQRKSYFHWRDAARYIARKLINESVNRKYNIAYVSNLISGNNGSLFQNLKDNAYRIDLLLLNTTSQNRYQSSKYRNIVLGFYESNKEDLYTTPLKFAVLFPKYLENADKVVFYWGDKFNRPSTIAAEIENSKLKNVDPVALEKFANAYNNLIENTDKSDLTWQKLMNDYT